MLSPHHNSKAFFWAKPKKPNKKQQNFFLFLVYKTTKFRCCSITIISKYRKKIHIEIIKQKVLFRPVTKNTHRVWIFNLN